MFTLVLISFGESVRKIDEFGSDADIFDCEPWRAGKNVEWINDGFGKFNRGATSRVIRKYGSYNKSTIIYLQINRIKPDQCRME